MYIVTSSDIDFEGLFDQIIFDKYLYIQEKKNTWSKDLVLGVRIYFSFANPNSRSLITHPPT